MDALESFKKTIADFFDFSSKSQQQNQPKTTNHNTQPSNDSKQEKNTPSELDKNPISEKNASSEIQNQRKGSLITNPMIQYIKTMLIEQEVECPICLSKYKKPGMIKIGQCGHQYCPPCLKQYVSERLKAYGMLKCPDETCNQLISKESAFYKSLNGKQKSLANKIQKFHYTSSDPYLRMCPTQHCDGIIPIIEGQPMKCPVCHNQFCKKCMYLKHPGKCTTNEVTYLNSKYRYRKCGRCGIIVEKTEACNHITCKCGYEFCYGCGRKWPGNGHHCNPTRVNRQQQSANQQATDANQSVFVKILKFIGQVILTIIMLVGVVFYAGVCLLPMMIMTLVSGILVGIFYYSFKFIYDTCKNESPELGVLLIVLFPLAMGFGIYNSFKAFWWEGFLFWWELLRQVIEKPLALIWNI